MARGWESKSVEAQQDDASRREPRKPALSEAERGREAHRRTLLLTRARAVDDLSRAQAGHHRRMLEEMIAALDARLAELQS